MSLDPPSETLESLNGVEWVGPHCPVPGPGTVGLESSHPLMKKGEGSTSSSGFCNGKTRGRGTIVTSQTPEVLKGEICLVGPSLRGSR